MEKETFEVSKEHPPKMVGRMSLYKKAPPVRAYLHESGKKLFGPRNIADNAYFYLLAVLADQKELISNFDYVRCFLWGKSNTRMIDSFGYNDTKNWPGNPNVYSWCTSGLIIAPEDPIIHHEGQDFSQKNCGDVDIINGIEEQYRRTVCLEDFSKNSPRVKGLELEFDNRYEVK